VGTGEQESSTGGMGIGAGAGKEVRRSLAAPSSLEVAYAELSKRYRSREVDLAAAAARSQALAEAGRAFSESSSGLESLLTAVVERTAILLGAGVSLFFLTEDRKILRLVGLAHANAASGKKLGETFANTSVPVEESLIGRAVLSGEPVFYPVMSPELFAEVAWQKRRDQLGALQPHSFLAIPLSVSGEIVAILSLSRDGTLSPAPFSEADRDFAIELSDRAALSIGHARAMEKLREELAERRKAEASLHVAEEQFRQAQKLEAVGRLAGGVAHDFNNLLSVILTTGQLVLADLPEGSLVHADIAQMVAAAEQATGLTRQLLTFSRKQVLEIKPVRLNAVVTETERMLKRVIGEDIELRTSLDPNLGVAKTDPGQIAQVIMNLAVNARDAMPRGGRLTLETANVNLDEEYVRLRLGASAGPHIMLSVSDTGEGMDEEAKQRLFEPFFTTKERGKGTGLGLSTVYGIVKQSGGNIFVYSELGRGTTFKIYLPRVTTAEVSPQPPPRAVPAAALGSGTVLLVEDDAMVRTVARRILARGGYQVLEARDVQEARQFCRETVVPIQLLLTDVVLPSMNGRELAAELLRMHPEMRVVFMSGYSEAAASQQDFIAPGSSFIEKPFTPETMLNKLRDVLRA